jgi:hypothetical protein
MRRQMAVMLLVLAIAPAVSGQTARGKGDPISGTWSGELVPSGAPRSRSITLELKYDGKGKVSGTIAGFANPGDVKKGTYEPKSGALRLELGKADDPTVLLIFDGKVEKNSATGRVTGEAAGEFTLTRRPPPAARR